MPTVPFSTFTLLVPRRDVFGPVERLLRELATLPARAPSAPRRQGETALSMAVPPRRETTLRVYGNIYIYMVYIHPKTIQNASRGKREVVYQSTVSIKQCI